MTLMSTYEQFERALRLKGVILSKPPGEFSVACGSRLEKFSTLEDPDAALREAVEAGKRMAARKPPAVPVRHNGKPGWAMRPKYRRRAQIRAFNRKLRGFAGRGRMV